MKISHRLIAQGCKFDFMDELYVHRHIACRELEFEQIYSNR